MLKGFRSKQMDVMLSENHAKSDYSLANISKISIDFVTI